MIDKEKIQQAYDNEDCIELQCANCPVGLIRLDEWECGAKVNGSRNLFYGLRPRCIRIMKEWLEANK